MTVTIEQIKQRKNDDPGQILSVRFAYNGVRRELDNVTTEKNGAILVGFEMRTSGQFSYKIKRFSADKVLDLELIDPPERSGPVIGRA
jgi:hypothetical protein